MFLIATVPPEMQIKIGEKELETLKQRLTMKEEKVKYLKKKAELQELKKSVLNSPSNTKEVLNSPANTKGNVYFFMFFSPTIFQSYHVGMFPDSSVNQ